MTSEPENIECHSTSITKQLSSLGRSQVHLAAAALHISKMEVIRGNFHLRHDDIGLDIHQDDWPEFDVHRELAVHWT